MASPCAEMIAHFQAYGWARTPHAALRDTAGRRLAPAAAPLRPEPVGDEPTPPPARQSHPQG